MSNLTPEQVARRERTLMAAVLLSMWGPLATGVAVVLSRSTTQLADFVRRTVELVALVASLVFFRRAARNPGLTPPDRLRLERGAGLLVATAMCVSGAVIAGLAVYRLTAGFAPGGSAMLGLIIAILGMVTNSWFWRRYAMLVREEPNSILETQRRLYRAKTLVDICVAAALAMVVLGPGLMLTRYVDIAGSLVVAGYLTWSGAGIVRVGSAGLGIDDPVGIRPAVFPEHHPER